MGPREFDRKIHAENDETCYHWSIICSFVDKSRNICCNFSRLLYHFHEFLQKMEILEPSHLRMTLSPNPSNNRALRDKVTPSRISTTW
ncbi:hypothetical protein CEXT_408401 [Caerostris extrusa]|uniref:Uncharacterized protein n=1 Tax=Caerostris extrusa TaxID=172846 RepID=A0AAV4SDX2_CAEEX|nr:hypothetical protein CEXT_408401 [Caerostris extrusa]